MEKQKFKLEKFKLVSGGGAEVHWEEEYVDGVETFNDKDTKKSGMIPVKELTDILLEMKAMFARAYDYSFIREVISNPDFEASKTQAGMAEKYYQEILKKITITGVTISGVGEKRGCIITATFTAPNNSKRGLATEMIKFNFQKYSFEEELERLCNELEGQAYEYVFNKKRAKVTQTSLFGGEDELETAGAEKEEN
jgi:hypothetical protein